MPSSNRDGEIERARLHAQAAGIFGAQDDRAGPGVHQELDLGAVDPGLDHEVAVGAGIEHQFLLAAVLFRFGRGGGLVLGYAQ